MVTTLAAEEQARRGLIAAVLHDLPTPLTSLRLLVDAIDDDLVTGSAMRHDYLGRISVNVHALSALIDDLFELSRLESGDIRWTMEQVRLDELVHDTIDAMRPRANAGSVVMRAELAPELVAARANPAQIQRVLFNLLQNAIRHTPAEGNVVVRAAPATGDAIEIEVADSGPGIALSRDHRGARRPDLARRRRARDERPLPATGPRGLVTSPSGERRQRARRRRAGQEADVAAERLRDVKAAAGRGNEIRRV